jgi:hypothetical protein
MYREINSNYFTDIFLREYSLPFVSILLFPAICLLVSSATLYNMSTHKLIFSTRVCQTHRPFMLFCGVLGLNKVQAIPQPWCTRRGEQTPRASPLKKRQMFILSHLLSVRFSKCVKSGPKFQPIGID